MTEQEFREIQWVSGMQILYKDDPTPYEVISVDFEMNRICFDDGSGNEDYPGRWEECKYCTIVEGNNQAMETEKAEDFASEKLTDVLMDRKNAESILVITVQEGQGKTSSLVI